MARSNPLYLLFIRFLATLMVMTSLCSGIAQAGMVSTDSLLTGNLSDKPSSDDVHQFLRKEDARQALQQLGVDPSQVQARVQDLSPDELHALNQQLEQMQAGGSSFIGVVVFVFLILILLDLLGTTDIFPAIKPIKVN